MKGFIFKQKYYPIKISIKDSKNDKVATNLDEAMIYVENSSNFTIRGVFHFGLNSGVYSGRTGLKVGELSDAIPVY